VVADDQETLEKAKALVKVEYEVLPAGPATRRGAGGERAAGLPRGNDCVEAHKHVQRGDAAAPSRARNTF
jgi:hypothetical protein